MKVRQGFIDGLGATTALLLGVPYFFMSFGKAWDARPEFLYIAIWLTLAAGATFGVIVVLTIVLRPSNLWLYPLMFALMTLIFGLGAITEPIAAAFWIGVGALTVGMGYGFGKITQIVARRARGAP
jgi:hypothetical protein